MKNSLNLKIISMMAAAAIVFTGCVSSNSIENKVTAYPATVLNITVEKQPKAVASLSPSIAQMLIDLGYKEKIVGYSSDFVSDEVTKEQKIGTGLKPDLKKIGTLAPEIIFTNVPLTKAQMSKVAEVGMKVVTMPVIKEVGELKSRYVDLITVMEGKIQANKTGIPMARELQEKLDFISSRVPKEKQSFLYVVSLDPIIATSDTFESSLLSVIGNNLAQDGKQYNMTAEQVQAMNPDMIFYVQPLDSEHIKQSELFKASKAVAENKLYAIDGGELALHNNSVAEVIRKLAKAVYPDIDFTAPPKPASSEPETKWYEKLFT